MTNDENRPTPPTDLRRRAEAAARERTAATHDDSALASPEEARKTLHELRVYQIELELQNEELRSSQAAVEAGRERYFDLFDLAPVGYCTLSSLGLILEANLTAAELLGTSRGLLVGQPISRYIFSDDQDAYYLCRAKVIEASKPQERELRLVKANGENFWAHLTGAAGNGEDGAPIIRVAISDISDRKLAEDKSETLQAQLLQAQKMESVGRLAGGVAHDFNNMLGVILGHLEIAMDIMGKDHALYADLEEAQKAAQHSAALTRQLLTFARKQIIAPKVLDINDAVEGALGMLRRIIKEDIAVDWKPGPALWPVKIDPAQVDQLLANLCVNARDAIADVGRITVETRNIAFSEKHCAAHSGFSPGEYVAIIVKDDGCGMEPETLPLIFEPFFTTKDMAKGTGLGLSTVFGIVRQNRGFVDVQSEMGQGTVFSIYLPRHAMDEAPAAAERPAASAPCGKETILLVEDEPAILRMTTILLERQGYTVLAASCPADAMRLAKEQAGKIDLLLTDVIMPEMNGRDLADCLLRENPGLNVLFMSGYTAEVIAHHGVMEEGVHFIQKPFSLNDLGVKVREAIGK